MNQVQQILDIIESLMDELSRGWLNYCAAKRLHEAYGNGRLTGAPWLFWACYQGCLESSVLALSRILIDSSKSIHIHYLLDCAEYSVGVFTRTPKATVQGSVAAHRSELEGVKFGMEDLKNERNWIIAHRDRRLITQPEVILSRSGVNMAEMERIYRLVLRIVNTYAGYLDGSELRLDNLELAVSSDLEYIIELMEKDQGIPE